MKFVAAISIVVLAISLELVSCELGWGFGRGDSSYEGSEEGCKCVTGRHNPCNFNASTYQIGCRGSNQYIQCNNLTCSNATCPANEVWNNTLGACATCPAGYQVRTDGQRCVCNTGTTFNITSRACGACPKNAVIQTDRCFCPNTTVFDPLTNDCRVCPTSSIQEHARCDCVNNTFWNAAVWQCQGCPGEWVSVGHRSKEQQCVCNGTNAIFNQLTVVCFTCPTGTTPSYDKSACECNIHGQYFDSTTNNCQCAPGHALNTANKCERVTTTTASPVAPAQVGK